MAVNKFLIKILPIVAGWLLCFVPNPGLLKAQPSPAGQNRPKLVVGIVVENMRPDYINRYWGKFRDDGFKKLYSEGAVCTNFKIEQHVQSYATGTATLFTGVYPSAHGIIGKSWYDRLKEKEAGCFSDENYFTVGGDTKAGNSSAVKLVANTVGDYLKLYTQGKSKVFSAALNGETAIFSAGHAADGAFWFDDETGRMISSSYYISTFPDWVRIFNSNDYAGQYAYRTWATLLPLPSYTESVDDDYLLEKGYQGKYNTFPHVINRYVKSAGDYRPLKTTPYGNTIIGEFAKGLIENENIGADEFTDLLVVAFSSMDYENGSFGPSSVEMEDTYLCLDIQIAGLMNLLEKKFGKNEILVFLTSNTSASYPVGYLKEEFNLAVGNFMPEGAFALLNSFLNLTYGDEKWIEAIVGQQVYMNRKAIEEKNIGFDEITAKAAEFIGQFEGVKVAMTARDLERGSTGANPYSVLYNSFNMNRCGDFVYMLEEGWQPSYKYEKVNYTDLTHIPLLFYGGHIRPQKITGRYAATSLVPTLSELMGIPPPDKCQDEAINELF